MTPNKYVKASITAEASLVCPVFLFAVLALIHIIIWFGEAEDVQRKLTEDIRKIQSVSFITGNICMIQDENGDIDLVNMYVADIHVPIPDLFKPVVRQHVLSRPFSGIESLEDGKGDEIVYITPNGAVYHVSCTCSYIKTALYSVRASQIDNKRNDSGGKYYPCERCGKSGADDMVYITSYGNRYHTHKECTSISRNVLSVFKSEVDGMRMCKKCGGR